MTDGLENVVAAETILSDVDGAAGQLTIRGHSLADLAEGWSLEEIVCLLFRDFFAELSGPAALTSQLAEARKDVHARLAAWLPRLAPLGPYDALRTALSMLPDGLELDDALRLVAAPAVVLPAIVRLRRGDGVIAPDPTQPHAADMARMLSGAAAPATAASPPRRGTCRTPIPNAPPR